MVLLNRHYYDITIGIEIILVGVMIGVCSSWQRFARHKIYHFLGRQAGLPSPGFMLVKRKAEVCLHRLHPPCTGYYACWGADGAAPLHLPTPLLHRPCTSLHRPCTSASIISYTFCTPLYTTPWTESDSTLCETWYNIGKIADDLSQRDSWMHSLSWRWWYCA